MVAAPWWRIQLYLRYLAAETSMCDFSELMLSIYSNFCFVGEKSLSNGSQMGHGARWGGVSIRDMLIRKYGWENRAGNYLLDI